MVCLHQTVWVQTIDPAYVGRNRLGFSNESVDLLFSLLLFSNGEVLNVRIAISGYAGFTSLMTAMNICNKMTGS